MKIIKLTTIILITLLTLTACGSGDKGTQNPNKHGLLNTTPKALPQTVTTKEDNKISIILKGSDEDNDTLGYKITKQPSNGTLKGKAPNITYTPNKDYNGKDSFTFIVNDGLENSKEAKVDIEITPVADLKELKLTIDKKETNKDTNTTYTITPIYDKGEIPQELKDKLKDITIAPNIKDSIKVNKETNTITAIKDGNITLQAKIDNILSNKVKLNVYWEVNGHRLPPEPDPKINNSTLLGIDNNNNGVRDDVERWIYEEYKGKHPIYAAIAMDGAEAFQEALKGESHYEKAHKMSSGAIMCASYYSNDAKYFQEEVLIDVDEIIVGRKLLSKVMTTQERIKNYSIYDKSLSGKVYSLPKIEDEKEGCGRHATKEMK